MARRGGKARPLVAACLYCSGIVSLARWWARASGPRLIILNYHRASGGDLRSHFGYLARHYRLLSLEEGLRELYTRQGGRAARLADNRTPLVVTFDDGYFDSFTHAFRLASELQVPITIFLIPGYIDTDDRFWWLEGRRLAYGTLVSVVTLDEHTYHLSRGAQREALARAIDSRLREAASVAEREAFLATMREALAVPTAVSAQEQLALPLTWPAVREMAASGWVSFGAHTMNHPVLAHLADPAEVRWEVAESRRVLEEQLRNPISVFAYPLGRMEHIGAYGVAAVQDAAFEAALTTIAGPNTPGTDPYLLRRVGTDVREHWLVLAAQAAGVWQLLLNLECRVRRPLAALALLSTLIAREGRRRAPRRADAEGRAGVAARWPTAREPVRPRAARR